MTQLPFILLTILQTATVQYDQIIYAPQGGNSVCERIQHLFKSRILKLLL